MQIFKNYVNIYIKINKYTQMVESIVVQLQQILYSIYIQKIK